MSRQQRIARRRLDGSGSLEIAVSCAVSKDGSVSAKGTESWTQDEPACETIGPRIPAASISACSLRVVKAVNVSAHTASRSELAGGRTLVSEISSGKRDKGTQTSVTQHFAPGK